MSATLFAKRYNQKSVMSENSHFNGILSVLLLPVDADKLTFNANITASTGQVETPSVQFTPCDDSGKVRVFSSVDDVVTWLRGAYLDISALSFTVDSMDKITKTFVPPTDAIKNATSKKSAFTKLRDGILDNIATLQAKVNADIASGWNAPTAHPALQANYAEDAARLAAATAIKDFYVAEIARYQAIITG